MTPITMKEVAAFLLGEASLDGYWFGERHPISPFWWREHLRAAQPATAPEPVAWMSPKRFYRTRAMALTNGEQLIEPLYLHPPATAPAQPEIVDLLAEMYELILANKVVLAEKSGGVWTWPDRAIEAVRKHRSGPAQPERKPTTRKAFEEWVKKNHPFGNLVGKADATEMFPDYWAACQDATDAALERAAEVCVDISAHQLTFQQRKSAATCAEAIRALKETP